MNDREKILKDFADYEPYAINLPSITMISSIYLDVLELVRKQQEIIRCKDCKYYTTLYCDAGCGWCKRNGIAHESNDEWFCADGERR